VGRDALASPCAQLVDAPVVFGDADHRHVQIAPAGKRLQRGKDLFVRQIARGAEKDECV